MDIGTDSAGNVISGAGNYQSGFDGGVFELRYESASFEVKNLLLSDITPAVGESIDLIASVQTMETRQVTILQSCYSRRRTSTIF